METNFNEDWKMDRIGSAHRGENPMVLTKLKSGFVVMGDTQFLPGYCVLLPLEQVNTLNDLDFKQRGEYLLDMSLIGDAIQEVCSPRRINYSIYGNTDAFYTLIFSLGMNGNPLKGNVCLFGNIQPKTSEIVRITLLMKNIWK